MGFGAERANLMGETPVSMPSAASTYSGHGVNEHGGSEVQAQSKAGDLQTRALNAKTNLIQEILAFNSEREQVEGASEDVKDEVE